MVRDHDEGISRSIGLRRLCAAAPSLPNLTSKVAELSVAQPGVVPIWVRVLSVGLCAVESRRSRWSRLRISMATHVEAKTQAELLDE